MLNYKAIEIFTSEEIKWYGRPIGEAVVQYVNDLRIAARCMVVKGTDGCYESGEVASRRLEVLSFNMPVRIDIILPAMEVERVLPAIEEMVTDGIIAVKDLHVVRHRTRNFLIPRQLRIRDVMTPSPVRVNPSTPVLEIIRLLLRSHFDGVPVVDAEDRPVGIITEGDLESRAGLPIRLGLLQRLDREKLEDFAGGLAPKSAEEIMSRPVVTVPEDEPLTEAVNLMLDRRIKRLPVVDARGTLVGMLSRSDVFRTISRGSPDWKALWKESIAVGNLRTVRDVMRRDAHTVTPETPALKVMEVIDSNDLQRVAVVDGQGRLLGLISDGDLLGAFTEPPQGIWEVLLSKLPYVDLWRRKEFTDLSQGKTAADVMRTDLVTVYEDTSIDEAIRLMTERKLKRLPVIDRDGRFLGMISRDALLRTGLQTE